MNDWWYIDVTTWTITWVNGSQDNYGVFVGANALGDDDWFGFYTKEHTSNNPKLVLNYTPLAIESASLGEIKAAFK
jgi:hypothetical protein